MDGVHDMGGTMGFGRVVIEPDEPVWHAEWEKVAFSMFPFALFAGWCGPDAGRFGIEQMPGVDYLNTSYYEHWLHTLEYWGTVAGAFDPGEVDKRSAFYLEQPDAPLPADRNPQLAGAVAGAIGGGVPAAREAAAPPRFAVGDRVRVRDDSPRGHTRRPRYIRGRVGEVVAALGAFVYPDSAGNGLGENPQHAYTVRFNGTDLWGEGNGDPNVSVYVEVFEPYAELVGEGR